MSVTSLLIFDLERLPTFDAVRAEAGRSGEMIDLFDPVDLTSHSGYLPVRVANRETGFEYYLEPLVADDLPPDTAQFGSHSIITSTGSSFEEGRAALLFLKVAARLTGGAYAYPDGCIVIPPDQVAIYLEAQIAEYGAEIEKRLARGKKP